MFRDVQIVYQLERFLAILEGPSGRAEAALWIENAELPDPR